MHDARTGWRMGWGACCHTDPPPQVLCPGISAVRAGGKGCCGAGCSPCTAHPDAALHLLLGLRGAGGHLLPLGVGSRPPNWTQMLQNRTLWNLCVEPPGVVSWNVTLFSLLVAASCLEIVLCGVQLVNASLGVFCGDCRKEVGRRGLELEREPPCSLAASSPSLFRRAPLAEAALTGLLALGRAPGPPRPGNKPLNSPARLR